MAYRITIEGSAQAWSSRDGQSVLDALAGCGTAVAVGCRSGGCGVCRVEVLHGEYARGEMSAEQISADCRARGYVLACRVYPASDLHLRPVGKRTPAGDNRNADVAALLASVGRLARSGVPAGNANRSP